MQEEGVCVHQQVRKRGVPIDRQARGRQAHGLCGCVCPFFFRKYEICLPGGGEPQAPSGHVQMKNKLGLHATLSLVLIGNKLLVCTYLVKNIYIYVRLYTLVDVFGATAAMCA